MVLECHVIILHQNIEPFELNSAKHDLVVVQLLLSAKFEKNVPKAAKCFSFLKLCTIEGTVYTRLFNVIDSTLDDFV